MPTLRFTPSLLLSNGYERKLPSLPALCIASHSGAPTFSQGNSGIDDNVVRKYFKSNNMINSNLYLIEVREAKKLSKLGAPPSC
jgi:hypothetical protein